MYMYEMRVHNTICNVYSKQVALKQHLLKISTLALPHVVTGIEHGWSQMTSYARC